MRANGLRRLLLLALVALAGAGGCRWARQVTWDLSARENEQYDPATQDLTRDQSYLKSVAAQRAQNEADYRASNPGTRPPGSR